MRGMKIIASAFAVFSLAPAAFESASAASDPTGIWMNDTGRGAIEIKHCGNTLCGNVVWVKNAADAKGCGKQIIGDVAAVGGGRWDNGWIYSPERGRRYNVELTPLDNGKLRVMGYAGMRFLSKTMIWTRAPENLQLCGQTEAKASPPATTAQPSTNSTANADAKPAAKPDVAMVSPPPPAPAPSAKADNAPPAPASSGAPPSPSANGAKSGTENAEAPKAQPDQPSTASKDSAPAAGQEDDKTASADDGASDLEKKLDGLGLGKVFTKTKSGKCKLDLPWVKVTIDCAD